MNVIAWIKERHNYIPLAILILIFPFSINAEAAYAHAPQIHADNSYQEMLVNAQRLTVSSDAKPQVINRDNVTVTQSETRQTFSPRSSDAGTSINGDIVATAKQFIGTPYVANSSDPSVGFDCSGFTKHVFSLLGIDLPHSSTKQGEMGVIVPMSEAIPGDLLIWEGHVAIYVGNGLMIDSAVPGTTINIRPIWGNPYVSRI